MQLRNRRIEGTYKYSKLEGKSLKYNIIPKKVGSYPIEIPIIENNDKGKFIFNIKVNPSPRQPIVRKKIKILENDIKEGMSLTEVTNLAGAPKTLRENLIKKESKIIYQFPLEDVTYTVSFISNRLRDIIKSKIFTEVK